MGKIAEYLLDEGTGTTAADSVASYDGTLDGSIAWAAGGVKGSAYAVSLVASSKVHIADVLAIGIGTGFGASAWVRRTSGSATRHAILSPEFNNNSFEFCLCCANSTADTFSLDYGAAWVAGYGLAASSTFSLNTWYHLAATARFSEAVISNCDDNGSGAIRVTATGHGFADGRAVRIRDVAGTTEANGAWTIAVIDADTFDLNSSTFSNTYTSGGIAYIGEVEFWVDAVSQGVNNLDVTVMGADDGGNDWSVGAQEDNYTADPYFAQFTDGKIDLVSIYNSSLSQSDVDSLYGDGPDGPPPVVSLTASTTSIAENGGTVSIIATLDATASATVTIAVGFAGGAATGSDYTLSTDTITIASGQTSGSLTATAISDSIYEGNEQFTASITSVTGGGASASSTASSSVVTIVDDDPPPTVSLTVSTASIAENAGTATITAILSATHSATTTVALGFAGTANSASDYSRTTTSISIASGQTSGSIGITAIQDALSEGNETIIVSIASVTGGASSSSNTLTVIIVDDDLNAAIGARMLMGVGQ